MQERKRQREAARCREWNRQEAEEISQLNRLKERFRAALRKDRP
jgi:type IV secretory pathway VirD2 relaxase